MPDLDLPAIRKALAEATPGPWTSKFGMIDNGDVIVMDDTGSLIEDRDLIVLLRNNAEALLAEIERLRKVEAAAREYRAWMERWNEPNADLLGQKEYMDFINAKCALDAALGGVK